MSYGLEAPLDWLRVVMAIPAADLGVNTKYLLLYLAVRLPHLGDLSWASKAAFQAEVEGRLGLTLKEIQKALTGARDAQLLEFVKDVGSEQWTMRCIVPRATNLLVGNPYQGELAGPEVVYRIAELSDEAIKEAVKESENVSGD